MARVTPRVTKAVRGVGGVGGVRGVGGVGGVGAVRGVGTGRFIFILAFLAGTILAASAIAAAVANASHHKVCFSRKSEHFLNESGAQLLDERCMHQGVPVLDGLNGGLMRAPDGDGCVFLPRSLMGEAAAGVEGAAAGVEGAAAGVEVSSGRRLIACRLGRGGEVPYMDDAIFESAAIEKGECRVRLNRDASADAVRRYNEAVIERRRNMLGVVPRDQLEKQLLLQEASNRTLQKMVVAAENAATTSV